MAKLYFRYGAMNSGKSTALMQVAHNYEEQGMQVLILKPQVDTKGGGELVSRLGVHRKADRLIRPDMDVFEVVREASQATKLACVLCDESQFFTAEQAEQLFMVTVDLNIPVICYGLRADFSLRGFPGSTRLLELAHTIEEMKTICTCGRKAICNCRKVNGQFVFEGEQVAIDLENDVQYTACARSATSARGGLFTQAANNTLCSVSRRTDFCAAVFVGFIRHPTSYIFCSYFSRKAARLRCGLIYHSRAPAHFFCAIDISVLFLAFPDSGCSLPESLLLTQLQKIQVPGQMLQLFAEILTFFLSCIPVFYAKR